MSARRGERRRPGRRGRRPWIPSAFAACVVLLFALGPSAATAQIGANPQPHPVPRCSQAGFSCIDDTLRHMERLQRKLGCDHRGVFATTYLILTREFDEVLHEQPDFFDHRAWMIYQDTMFANMYFRPVAEYVARGPVPEAWRIAFDTAGRRDANAGQDMLLGINAHVQRDFPYMLAELGIRTPDGTSRKPDHDRVNQILARAYEPVVRTIGRYYDPMITTTNSGWTPADNLGGLALVGGWREGAWRNAERLLAARTPAERKAVELSIEQNAAAWARSIAQGEQPGYRERRDAYCARRLPFGAEAPKPPFALELDVEPRRARAGHEQRFRFRAAVTSTGWWYAPVGGATVRFAEHSARTDARGFAAIAARLSAGEHTAAARRDGLRAGRATVRAGAGVEGGTAGSPADDVLVGTPGDDVIRCGSGHDRVDARGGDDTVWCGSGDDTVLGGSGNDRLHGQSGDDTLDGGPGDDLLRGASGDDRLIGGPGRDRR